MKKLFHHVPKMNEDILFSLYHNEITNQYNIVVRSLGLKTESYVLPTKEKAKKKMVELVNECEQRHINQLQKIIKMRMHLIETEIDKISE